MGVRVTTLRFAVKASPSQHRRLGEILGWACEMYNAVLESWKGTYAWWREHNPGEDRTLPAELRRSRYDLFKMFTQVRAEDPRWGGLDTRVGRGVICRFERATRSFYRRCGKGQNPGYPRFKPRHRWKSIEVPDASPSMLSAPTGGRWWRLRVKGVPAVRFADRGGRLRSALEEGKLVELRVVRTPLRVELHAVFRHQTAAVADTEPSNPVGVDKGLTNRLALSDGTYVEARTPDLSTARRYQRRLSRAKPGSRSRVKKRAALARARRRETERARQADFRLAHQLVTTFDAIAVEDLNISGMLRSKMFSRKMSEQRWGAFDLILEHKAAKAGVLYVKVNPKNTTTDCSRCGHRRPMPLHQREYRCPSCGLRLCRDHNAARNICARAFPEVRGREGTSPGAARNMHNNHRKTTPPLTAGTRMVAAEQYACAPKGTQAYKPLIHDPLHG